MSLINEKARDLLRQIPNGWDGFSYFINEYDEMPDSEQRLYRDMLVELEQNSMLRKEVFKTLRDDISELVRQRIGNVLLQLNITKASESACEAYRTIFEIGRDELIYMAQNGFKSSAMIAELQENIKAFVDNNTSSLKLQPNIALRVLSEIDITLAETACKDIFTCKTVPKELLDQIIIIYYTKYMTDLYAPLAQALKNNMNLASAVSDKLNSLTDFNDINKRIASKFSEHLK